MNIMIIKTDDDDDDDHCAAADNDEDDDDDDDEGGDAVSIIANAANDKGDGDDKIIDGCHCG